MGMYVGYVLLLGAAEGALGSEVNCGGAAVLLGSSIGEYFSVPTRLERSLGL